MVEALRNGTWLTAARLRAYPLLVLIPSLLGVAALVAGGDGTRDWMHRPLGTDFSQVWAAGVQVLGGHPAAPFDPATHAAAQRALFGADTPFYGWHYPPFFLLVATLLALLPYGAALLVWQATTLPLYLGAVLAILRRSGLPRTGIVLAAAAFPAVFVNLTHGHNGFLSAGLLAFGFLALRDRPVLAGVLFGLLAYKPQFGLVLPVALLAGGCWRTLAAGAATVASMTAVTVMLFGVATWRAFGDSLAFTRTVVLEQGNTGWEKIQSPFAAARMLGAGIGQAYAVQTAVTLAAFAVVALAWRSRAADPRLKAALAMVASLLTTPYCLDYDLMILGPALAFAVAVGLEEGFGPWEKTLLAAVWVAPALARVVAETTDIPLGLGATTAFFLLLARRALLPRPTRSAVASLIALPAT